METLSALLALCEGNPCGDQRTVLSLIANALETLQSCTALSHQLLQLDIKQFKFKFLAQPSIITHTTENWQSSWCQLCCHWWHQRLLLRQPLVPPVTTKLASWWPRIHSESWWCQLCNPHSRHWKLLLWQPQCASDHKVGIMMTLQIIASVFALWILENATTKCLSWVQSAFVYSVSTSHLLK